MMAEWKKLALEQRETLASKEILINRLRDELTQSDAAKSELRFQLTETETAYQDATCNAEAKLALILRKYDKQNNDLAAENVRLREELCREQAHNAAARSARDDAEIKVLKETLRITRNERDASRQQCGSLQKQLEVEIRTNRQNIFTSDPKKGLDLDQDDDEECVANVLRRPSMPTPSKPPATPVQQPKATFRSPKFVHAAAPIQQPKATFRLAKAAAPDSPAHRPIASFQSRKSLPSHSKLNSSQPAIATKGPQYPRPSTQTPIKRKRQPNFEEELKDLALDTHAPLPAKRRRKLVNDNSQERGTSAPNKLGLQPTGATKRPAALAVSETITFDFKMVTGYPSCKKIEAHESVDMRNQLELLWERIAVVQSIWESRKGTEWSYEFEKTEYKQPETRVQWPCITSKFLRARGSWHPGCEGKYACGGCVKANRPCFVYTGGKFWLLPVRDEERKVAVKEGFEVRYWIVDEDEKTMGVDEEDEDY